MVEVSTYTDVGDGTGDGAGDCLSQGDRTADEKGEETVERNAESHWCASIFEFVVLNLVSFGCIFVSPRDRIRVSVSLFIRFA